jgi:hypothetical protein
MVRAEREYALGLAREIRDGTLGGVGFWRRSVELVASGEVTFAEIMADPAKYLGEEAGWLANVPDQAR